jgi:hypothetical protein
MSELHRAANVGGKGSALSASGLMDGLGINFIFLYLVGDCSVNNDYRKAMLMK